MDSMCLAFAKAFQSPSCFSMFGGRENHQEDKDNCSPSLLRNKMSTKTNSALQGCQLEYQCSRLSITLDMGCRTSCTNNHGLDKGQMTSKCSHFLLFLASGYLNISSCRIYPESNNTVSVKLEAAEMSPRVMRESAIITVKCDQNGMGRDTISNSVTLAERLCCKKIICPGVERFRKAIMTNIAG